MQQEIKQCQNCKKDFTIEPEDFDFYEKMKVPAPTFCPECRLVRRLTFRNERTLYKRGCDLCKKQIISIYSPDKKYRVYCQECWWSDQWDQLKDGADIDFSIPFLRQVEDLQTKVPKLALVNTNSVKSEYTNYAGNNKNCYLIFSNATGNNEDCAYGTSISACKQSFDLINVYNSDFLYDCIDCQKCYRLTHASYCFDSMDCFLVEDCRNCTNCIGCKGLRNSQYFILNEQFTKDDYEKKVIELDLHTYFGYKKLLKDFEIIKAKIPSKFSHIIKTENSSGDYITNSKDCHVCFDVNDTERAKYVKYSVKRDKDIYDVGYVTESELGYETISFVGSYDCQFCNTVWWQANKLRYCEICFNSSNLFACIGLRNKSYCILNKQYTKEEYEALVPKIIWHMNNEPYEDAKGMIYKYGEFFPSELSPFCYNETIAQEYFSLTKDEALTRGYKWKDKEERNYVVDIKNEDIPDGIGEVDEKIISKVIECEHKGECNEQCTEAFKVIPQEVQFYKAQNLPLPRLCPNCRHHARLAQRNPMKLWHRQCMCDKDHPHHAGKCTNEFETAYAPDRPEIVYCEQCYQLEVA